MEDLFFTDKNQGEFTAIIIKITPLNKADKFLPFSFFYNKMQKIFIDAIKRLCF